MAYAAARRLPPQDAPVVILSTAHPAKFPDAVAKSIGAPPPVPARLQGLQSKPERMEKLPNKLALIRDFISSRLAG